MAPPNDLPREPRFRDPEDPLRALLSEWSAVCRQCLDEVEGFTRERPAAGLAIAFLAGTFFVSLFRRR